MNAYQTANMALEVLLGTDAKAIWLSSRVDGKSVAEIAKDFKIGRGRVREVLAAADFAVEQAALAPAPEPKRPLRTNWNGFHQSDED